MKREENFWINIAVCSSLTRVNLVAKGWTYESK
uniref:Uncharacterized protein n=1 Tax=Rhizophora mucronata TaxID=61149 RepID=A0A2P2NPG4_RHIMU